MIAENRDKKGNKPNGTLKTGGNLWRVVEALRRHRKQIPSLVDDMTLTILCIYQFTIGHTETRRTLQDTIDGLNIKKLMILKLIYQNCI